MTINSETNGSTQWYTFKNMYTEDKFSISDTNAAGIWEWALEMYLVSIGQLQNLFYIATVSEQ